MRRAFEKPAPAALIVAAMWSPSFEFSDILTCLENEFGRIAFHSPVFSFSKLSSYYAPEMGENLSKCFFAFEASIDRHRLIEMKKRTYDIETKFLTNTGERQVNLDPMILTLENLIIATSKNYSHRVYLGDGVFGDLALIRKGRQYQPLPWTYPDYQTHLDFFEKVRQAFYSG